MSDKQQRTRLETEAVVLGYAMSRLDAAYLDGRGCRTWKSAFEEVAAALTIRTASIKNLRDESIHFMAPDVEDGIGERSGRTVKG